MDMTTSSKSYHLGTAGTDTQLKTRKITTKAFAVYGYQRIHRSIDKKISKAVI